MSTRPRPRPKPRARVPASGPPSSPGASTSAFPPASNTKDTPSTNVDDEDAFFIRKPRMADAWRKMEQIAEGVLSHLRLCSGVGKLNTYNAFALIRETEERCS